VNPAEREGKKVDSVAALGFRVLEGRSRGIATELSPLDDSPSSDCKSSSDASDAEESSSSDTSCFAVGAACFLAFETSCLGCAVPLDGDRSSRPSLRGLEAASLVKACC
jgi:hypothetical protein